MNIAATYETLKGEHLKTMAEGSLHQLGRSQLGRKALEHYAFGPEGRIVDDRLRTDIAGIELENPTMVGAGWDKKGRAIVGLQALGFAAVEVGTVPLFGQYGNKRPRLWTIDQNHAIGLNRLGFNSLGSERVDENLDQHATIPMPLGINVGLNKLMPATEAPWAHAEAAKRLVKHASYIALGISSPNTAQVRGLQSKEPLTELTQAVQEAIAPLPLFFKIDGDQGPERVNDIIEVALENNVAGIIAINTTVDTSIKAKYGTRWAQEMGGLSGADPDYQRKAVDTVRFIYETAGDKLTIVGAGGVSDAETALTLIKAGASGVQIVTAIRPSWGRVAAHTNRGLLKQIEQDGTKSIRDYVGADTKRGATL